MNYPYNILKSSISTQILNSNMTHVYSTDYYFMHTLNITVSTPEQVKELVKELSNYD